MAIRDRLFDTEGKNGVASVHPNRPVKDWRHTYAGYLVVTDLLVLIWVVFGVQLAWLGFDRSAVGFSGSREDITVSYTAITCVIVAAWMIALSFYDTRADRVVGIGATEYKLILSASVALFGGVAIVAFLFKIDLARGYILMAFPLGILVLLLSRWMWRQWLRVQRNKGRFASRVLLVGSEKSVIHIAREFARSPDAGYMVVGACVPSGRVADTLPGTDIPVSGNVSMLVEALAATGADTVVITSADELPPQRVRELSWSLEPGRQHLVVAPSLTDIGGPRIHTRPVVGLPLIHVETPRYDGRKRFTKRSMDIVTSGALVLLLSPALLVIALLVKLSGPGDVLYRQERIGKGGQPFHMLKFRSMVADADSELERLLEEQGTDGEPLFKVRNDPRVTKVGGFLRKYSLDELPQLLNVVRGDMSLVGPRPQREGEVALYDQAARRRLIVEPGMTGLWQVSGRSTLSWEDAIRLDLYYVENWSLAGDLSILWKTFRAVVAPGAEAF